MRYKLALALAGIVFSVAGLSIMDSFGQSSTASVVINEVETNPPGDDSKSISEWAELYNPTDSEIDLSKWKIASTTGLKRTLQIQEGTIIKPGQFMTFSYLPLWFTDSSEVIELRNENDIVIDKTPALTDSSNDFKSWQRVYDGFDTDSSDDWKFTTSTAGSSNGKPTMDTKREDVSVSVSTDKSQYVFGNIVTIAGKVSEQVFFQKPFFQPEKILVDISGPSYQKTVMLYPDRNLGFKTTLNLQKILGFNQGIYDVTVTYGKASDSTQFSIVSEITQQEKEEITGELEIKTDRESYMPGQKISISASTNKVVPLAGLKFQVIDPLENVIYSGDLFPSSEKRSLTGNSNAQFATTISVDAVKPAYGTYKITAEYSGQVATTTFELNKDVKEDKPISLRTDKDLYAPGDTVKVTGRLNTVWITALDLSVVQTKNIAISGKTEGGGSDFKISDIVRIAGDGSFSYSFKIPNKDTRLGDYRVKVSKEIGSAIYTFKVVQDPDRPATAKQPFSIDTNKEFYDLGEKLTITGTVANRIERSSGEEQPVTIFLTDDKNKKLSIVGLPSALKTRQGGGVDVAYQFTAVPDLAGNFKVDTTVSRSFFKDGAYKVHARYSDQSTSASFIVVDPAKTGEKLMVSLDKQVYGLGDTIQVSGLVPNFSQGTSVTITLFKPNGNTEKFNIIPENSRFIWSWQAPSKEKAQSVKEVTSRAPTESNFGVYKVRFSASSVAKEVSFKLSPNPETDIFVTQPITITTDKPMYRPGDKLNISGFVQEREQGKEGLVVPERVHVKVQTDVPHKTIYESSVFPKNGKYDVHFDLPATVFEEGSYRAVSQYVNAKAEAKFRIESDFVVGGIGPVSINVNLDKDEYVPGELVTVTGKPSKLVYLEKYDISVIKKSDKTSITCGAFYCGKHAGPVTTVRPSPSGSFTYTYQIPAKTSSIGDYEITIDVGFDTVSKTFKVVESKPDVEETKKMTSQKVIDKVTGISENSIGIVTSENMVNDTRLIPKAIRGILISAGPPHNVNLKVSSENGVCIIGQEEGCLITNSTRADRQVYSIVEVDGKSYNVRYSGHDARLERFTILTSENEFLPDVTWNVEVIKEVDSSSRFNYQINYERVK